MLSKTRTCSLPVSDGLGYPASLIQQQFWLLHQLAPSSPAYNVPSVSAIEGDLDTAALGAALNALVRGHRVFRACFTIDDAGMLTQKAAPWEPAPLPETVLRFRNGGAPGHRAVDRAVRGEVLKPFDLASGPPLRFRLFRTGDRAYVLAITAHHIVFDLATKDLFARQLAEEYRAALPGETASQSAETTAYDAFSLWQERWMQSTDCRKMEESWRRYLDGMQPLLDLPAERQPARGARRSGALVPLRIDGEMRGLMRIFCRDENVTPFLVLLTAWALTLARWSGQTKCSLGVPFTNRRKDEFKQVMGCFVNILPLVFDISGSPSLREAVHDVRMAMLKMHRMQEIPYSRLVHLMRDLAAAGRNPFFQAGFTFEHPMRLQLDGVRVTPQYVHNGGALLDLFARFWEEEDGIVGYVEYDAGRFDASTVERIASSLQTAVLEICKGAERKVGALSLVPAVDVGSGTARVAVRKDGPTPLCSGVFPIQTGSL